MRDKVAAPAAEQHKTKKQQQRRATGLALALALGTDSVAAAKKQSALAGMVSPATRALWKAVELRKPKRAAKAIEEGADPNALAGVGTEALDQLSALHRAVQLCVPALVDAIAEAAKRKGVALEWGLPSSRYGYTPLMMATVGGSQRRPEPSPAQEAATVVAALKAGAQVSINDRGATGFFMEKATDLSYTPLLHFLSLGRKRWGCAQALLDAGADSLRACGAAQPRFLARIGRLQYAR